MTENSKNWITLKLICGLFCVVIVCAIYWRWESLIGEGFTYALVGGGTLGCASVFVLRKHFIDRFAGIILFGLVGWLIAVTLFPTYLDSSMESRIQEWRHEQDTKNALEACLSDNRYDKVSVTVIRTKVLWFKISGTLKDRDDFESLRAAIKASGPAIDLHEIQWDLNFASGEPGVAGYDYKLFPEKKHAPLPSPADQP